YTLYVILVIAARVFTDYYFFSFFFTDTASQLFYTLSLHDALPISPPARTPVGRPPCPVGRGRGPRPGRRPAGSVWFGWSARPARSEEHTSELQSRENLVCRLLLEKKK